MGKRGGREICIGLWSIVKIFADRVLSDTPFG
jgi:hypothetical protein